MLRVDLFKADRKMGQDVATFVQCVILRKSIQLTYKSQIEAVETSLANLDNLAGSILADTIPQRREELTVSLDKLIKARDAQIEAEAKFEKTANDKRFVKALKGVSIYNRDKVVRAIRAWFKEYSLEVADSDLEYEVLQAIGGKTDFHKLVDSLGTEGTSIDNNRALQMMYWVLYRRCVIVGTIKDAQIPEIIRANYGKKAMAAKRAAKKAEKKADKR